MVLLLRNCLKFKAEEKFVALRAASWCDKSSLLMPVFSGGLLHLEAFSQPARGIFECVTTQEHPVSRKNETYPRRQDLSLTWWVRYLPLNSFSQNNRLIFIRHRIDKKIKYRDWYCTHGALCRLGYHPAGRNMYRIINCSQINFPSLECFLY